MSNLAPPIKVKSIVTRDIESVANKAIAPTGADAISVGTNTKIMCN